MRKEERGGGDKRREGEERIGEGKGEKRRGEGGRREEKKRIVGRYDGR